MTSTNQSQPDAKFVTEQEEQLRFKSGIRLEKISKHWKHSKNKTGGGGGSEPIQSQVNLFPCTKQTLGHSIVTFVRWVFYGCYSAVELSFVVVPLKVPLG